MLNKLNNFILGIWFIFKIVTTSVYMRIRYGKGSATLYVQTIDEELKERLNDTEKVEQLINEIQKRKENGGYEIPYK